METLRRGLTKGDAVTIDLVLDLVSQVKICNLTQEQVDKIADLVKRQTKDS